MDSNCRQMYVLSLPYTHTHTHTHTHTTYNSRKFTTVLKFIWLHQSQARKFHFIRSLTSAKY